MLPCEAAVVLRSGRHINSSSCSVGAEHRAHRAPVDWRTRVKRFHERTNSLQVNWLPAIVCVCVCMAAWCEQSHYRYHWPAYTV